MGFVFYDVETTGLDKHFDQILQFAAIRTDADLNEIDRVERRCRIIPHIVPSPGALRVTRVSVEQLVDPALPSHYEMICELAAMLAEWGPAIYLGWNTIDFDEHMLRQALFQCLHPPYLTNTEGNSRCDAIKIAQSLQLIQPGALAIPLNEKGKPSFKLDQLAPANGFDHANAHDALADVEATIHICRLIRDRAPDHWSQALRFVNKAAPLAFMEDTPAFIATECYFGAPYQYALTMIAPEEGSSSVLTYDLAVDPDELRAIDDALLPTRLGRKVKPVRRIRANAAPLLHDIYDTPGFYGMTPDELTERAEEVRGEAELCARLVAAAEREPFEPSPYVEAQIYDDFSGDADRARMHAFHAAPSWNHRAALAGGFDDVRLVELAGRLIFHHAPDALEANERAAIERGLAVRMLGHGFEQTPWLTLAAADRETETLLAKATEEERVLLTALRAHLKQETGRCAALIG